MKTILTCCLFLFIFASQAQVAKSFNFSGTETNFSGTYIAKHPSQSLYYTATIKKDNISLQNKTIVTQLDGLGNTLWYSSSFIATGSYGAIGDIVATNDFVFVSCYVFPFGQEALNIYKLDHSGNLLDSIVIAGSGTGGLAFCRSQMAIDADGNLFTNLKTGSNIIQFVKVDPTTMDVITQINIGHTSFSNYYIERGIFTSVVGTNSVITYNAEDTIKSVVINSSGIIIDDSYFLSPDGEATDVEFVSSTNQFYILINKYFNPSLASANPIRIITMDINGMVTSNVTWTVQNPVVFTNIAINPSDAAFVSSRSQNSTLSGGTICKISGGVLEYEHHLKYTNLHEIDLNGNYFFATGDHFDETEDCDFFNVNTGSAIIIHKASVVPDFEVVSPHMTLEFNNITAEIAYTSRNFFNPITNQSGYEIAGAGSTIYNTSLLIAGEDINGNLLNTCATNDNMYSAGPITNTADYNQLERDKWERVWVVSKAEIDAHIQAHLTGDVNYKTPDAILNWPANGDPSKGQSQQLARFQDLNGNTGYEPLLGEYPLIKGDYCALSVYNDVNTGFVAGCLPANERMNVQVFEYAYGFDCAQDSSLQNTLYIYYEVISKLATTTYNTYIGNGIDMDINSAVDDYISSDPMRGMFYCRNEMSNPGPEQAYVILGSTQDEDGIDNAIGIGSGESPNGFGHGNGTTDDERLGMTNFIYYNIGGGVNGSPNNANDYYLYMQSVWKNNTHVLFGGNGFNVGTVPLESNYMFQEDDDLLFYATNGVDPAFIWSEELSGNPVGDRRGIASSGPFTLNTLDTICFDIAYVTGMENNTTGYTSHEALITNVDSARNYFAANATSCGQDFDFYAPYNGVYPFLEIENVQIAKPILFPNPTNGNFTIQGLTNQTTIRIFSTSGQLISESMTNQTSINFDYSDLPKGIYFVQIKDENYSGTLRVIKQ